MTPVDEGNDGTIDYYKVEAVERLDEEQTIPGNVNGIPVKEVEKLYKNENNFDYGSVVKKVIIEEGVETLEDNALAYTSDLSEVQLPSTTKFLGKNLFSRNFYGDLKKLTIIYNGTMDDFKKLVANSDGDWYNGLKSGTTVVCTDGTFTLSSTSYGVTVGNYKWSPSLN